MKPRIAVPEPCPGNREYTNRVLPEYVAAIEEHDGQAVVIKPELTVGEIIHEIERCSALLLPSCSADVDPQIYGAARHAKTAQADRERAALDELMLQDAYAKCKPVFGICYGLQFLSVWHGDQLIQDITAVSNYDNNHNNGNHPVRLWSESKRLGYLGTEITVQSKHRQAAAGPLDADPLGKYLPGEKLKICGINPKDKIVEAIEGTEENHFVLGGSMASGTRFFDKLRFTQNFYRIHYCS